MKTGCRRFAATVAWVFVLSAVGHAQYEKIEDYYTRNAFPAAQIKTGARDADVARQLNLPAVLAVLKYELAVKKNFCDISFTERGQLLAILNDRNMVLEYTGLQERMGLTRGGQAIDKNLVRLDQAAFYVSGGPRPVIDIAKIILHELGHVWQLRHGTVTQYVWKEKFPEYLEANLLQANFADAVLSRVGELMGGKKAEDAAAYDPAVVAWEGTWQVTSTWTSHKNVSATWRFKVDALKGNKCQVTAGRNVFSGTIDGNTLKWTDPGKGVHKLVNYTFQRTGDTLKGTFDGKNRADQDIAGTFKGHRVE